MDLAEKIDALLNALEEKNKQVSALNQELDFTKKELREAGAESVELQKKYDNLKIAKGAVSLSKGDISEAKKKITDIMARIDVCIDKLSNQ